VDEAMLFEFHGPSECFLAHGALVRLIPSVDEAMLFEVYSPSELFKSIEDEVLRN
jgi:hypothetical protein